MSDVVNEGLYGLRISCSITQTKLWFGACQFSYLSLQGCYICECVTTISIFKPMLLLISLVYSMSARYCGLISALTAFYHTSPYSAYFPPK